MSDKVVSLRALINPTPRQEEFLKATDTHKYPLFGGAKGGGKSYILRWGLVRKLLHWAKAGHKGVRVGLFCEDYPSLKDRQITKIAKEFPVWLGKLADSQIEGMSFKLAPQYGSGVLALRNLDDPSKYASSEFAVAAMDEVTKNKREVFDQLRSIVRWPGIEDTGLWGGTNPGGIGHDWVKKLWIDRTFSSEDPPAEQFYFVKSLPTDNPHNARSYLDDLARLPEKLRKAYYDGSWTVFEGQYFSEWDQDQHSCVPFVIPEGWKKFRAYDHGREAPAACLWFALDYDGRVWCYRELYLRGKNVDEIASEIRNLSAGETYDYSVADPAIFARMGFVDAYGGQTIAESFARQGVNFIPASNRRLDGWALMHQYLYWDVNKKPKLIFFNTCYNSIRTIPSLIHDDHRQEDVDTMGEDHCFTADTEVDTLFGKKRIGDLVGQSPLVNTLVGFMPARSVRLTGRMPVMQLTLGDGRTIRATADHKFLTSSGWKMLKDIDARYDVLIQSGICTKSYLKLFRSLAVFAIISAVSIFREMVKGCTSWFGRRNVERSPKDSTSTTKTTTEATTPSRTWNVRQRLNTFLTTRELQRPENVPGVQSRWQSNTPAHGTRLQMAEGGIANTPKRTGRNTQKYAKFARSVLGNILSIVSSLSFQNIATPIVRCVPCGEEEVYDLTVPGIEHFTIAGGIVVHNCPDATRYMLNALHERVPSPPLTPMQQVFEKMKEKDSVGPQTLSDFYLGRR